MESISKNTDVMNIVSKDINDIAVDNDEYENISNKNIFIQRENKAPRRSKYLALETVREGNALNGSVEMK